jgi:hypothetical protein
MIKKISVIGIMFLLMVSLASASVLDYYGKIEGSANVKGPTFYAYPERIEDYKLYKLGINEPPITSGEISFTDGDFIGFATNPLEITSFYPANYKFYVKAKVESPPRGMKLELWVRDNTTGDLKQEICEANVTVTSLEYNTYEASCSGGSLALSESDGFYWKLYGLTTASVNYSIKIDGDTKIEVSV